MRRLILLLILAAAPTAALPQHVCERTGRIVCPEGQEWNAETSACETTVSS